MYSLALIIFVISEKKEFNIEPYGKNVQNASSLKPLGQLKPNCPGMIIGRFSTNFIFFYADRKSKMATTAIHKLTLDPMGKMFQNASSLKPLGQLKPNCPGMIIGRSSTKFLFFFADRNSRWPPPQDID
jgi:hypothetical protein